MTVLTDEQAKWYALYTTVAEKSMKRINEIDEILNGDWDADHNIIHLVEERDALDARFRWACGKRLTIETERSKYENHLKEAERLKKKWGF